MRWGTEKTNGTEQKNWIGAGGGGERLRRDAGGDAMAHAHRACTGSTSTGDLFGPGGVYRGPARLALATVRSPGTAFYACKQVEIGARSPPSIARWIFSNTNARGGGSFAMSVGEQEILREARRVLRKLASGKRLVASDAGRFAVTATGSLRNAVKVDRETVEAFGRATGSRLGVELRIVTATGAQVLATERSVSHSYRPNPS